ncbi:exported hypothetical protein [Cupriavidus necator]|uniref:TonB-dependent receptor plug domain-containing protein n=1 Tax=Cupriavidus necator TaxID=106590 RepID=A0A1K0K047_CUPNE|nr:exported hypothetical protein [Cupriavidus necator]
MRWIPAAVGLMVSASAFGQENATGSASAATRAEQPAAAGSTARQPEQSLPAVTVNGARENPVNPPTTAGSKGPLTAREVPQSVTVVNAERIREQNLTTLEDAMMQATGVFVEKRDQERSIYYSRGLEIDTFMLDGVPTKYDWRNTVQPGAARLAAGDRARAAGCLAYLKHVPREGRASQAKSAINRQELHPTTTAHLRHGWQGEGCAAPPVIGLRRYSRAQAAPASAAAIAARRSPPAWRLAGSALRAAMPW